VPTEVADAFEVLRTTRRILAFTGAGISTESGIPDFRGPDGLWNRIDPDEFNIGRFRSDPEVRKKGWRLHQEGKLWGTRAGIKPNAGHEALVILWQAGRMSGCVTQNIDGLHHAAGLPEEVVAELHGNVRQARCLECWVRWPTDEVLKWVDAGQEDPSCPHCGGIVKTATIMFGENLPESEVMKAWRLADDSDAVLAIGSTLSVWPAAEIPLAMHQSGKPLVIVNKGPTDMDHLATVRMEGGAGEVLTDLVERLLNN
jgi:NAD-dependent deacetylase